MKTADIQRRWLEYFGTRGHTVVPSASLVSDDPTLLFTVAGMVPFVPYLTGVVPAPYPRATSVQKCIRTNDIEEVGKTPRHGTFFQMNGNFSFGDYFKEGAIGYAWELLTSSHADGGFGFAEKDLWVTVYKDDDEAIALWKKIAGLPDERIQRLGMDTNYWSTGQPGPAGPCSEIFFDRGPAYGVDGGPATDDDRYVEIWNLVFMQYLRGAGTGKGDFEILGELPSKNIDTGMSMSRTIGTWLAALFTLAIFSFLYRDNPFYKTTESIIVGVSAAYWMVVGFWDTLVPILFANLMPGAVRASIQPGIEANAAVDWKYLIPLALGIMLLWRLAPVGGWISRWPMAFIIGAFCGLRLVAFIHADFLSQINGSIIPIWAVSVDPATPDAAPTFDFWPSVKNIVLLLGILCCLVYFFFSIEHKGAVGHTARVGIFFLMVTFGAAFGYTVMGRIALLAIRLEFLFDDWLWLIDPMQRRAMDIVAFLM